MPRMGSAPAPTRALPGATDWSGRVRGANMSVVPATAGRAPGCLRPGDGTLYRLGLGGLLGGRLVLLTRTGRSSGKSRQVVLEIVGRHDDGGYLIASGYGSRAQWYRNVLAEPRVVFQLGWRRQTGRVCPVPANKSGRYLRDHARRHPRRAALLMWTIGQCVDGSDAAYERIGSDPDRGVPILRVIPD
ncbi:nitroreductase family deazaflavin-dependent oxidoreductase [Micromonosporaceae bacterium B7E4]